ncbi:GNAT family N-acetyltransferase [Pseudoalteromonas peptidolytica]|uniref:Putative acetyltransferase n=1 Tax=Pseudoalteromonas peptidolytica F12-50-A1 TaxID=1315280 RepID=A0A8I0T2W1_9GAMM|nr:GNAT family N-acetyltransferase [Pseudoalteromonas peptidolytica]MBE0345766.1 putative acetyltransferase [Pseudoalteromonas peptidolytica F12-50-A1]NLR14379.1 GNAT family N-acetyltransferase [Pseudoalteromonas peptidolytica]GEK07938.1 acetyltransferase [Pseudoalteromonas peptidolytica]
MEIIELDPKSESVKSVVNEIDDLMNTLYPQESNQLLSIEELMSDDVYFIGVKNGKEVIGCGAIVRKCNDGIYGELKRIYVKPNYRGKGISKSIMNALIAYAKEERFPAIRLETGIKQSEAINLYEKLGFRKRKQFGSYLYDPLSIYMELELCV